MSRDLVKAVDVLRDQGAELAALFKGHQRTVAGIRLGVPGRVLEAAAPGQLSNVGIRHVMVDIGQALRFGIACPDALGTTKVRDARFR